MQGIWRLSVNTIVHAEVGERWKAGTESHKGGESKGTDLYGEEVYTGR